MKAYLNLGLTEKEVIEMQHWMYPMINETGKISDMILNVVNKYQNEPIMFYALYHLGNRMGEAQTKEQLNLPCILNPDEV